MSDDEKTSVGDIGDIAPKSTVACLCVIAGVDVGRIYRLNRGENILGRAEGVDVHIEDEGVSRHHAKILMFEGEPSRLVDLGSTNGSFVNSERAENAVLHDGDWIQLGRGTVLAFRYQHPLEEAYQQQHYQQATRDTLTGLHNIRYFRERLASEFSYAARQGGPLAVVALEVLAPKGRELDAVARHYGRLIADAVRAEDVLARTGALSFAVLSREGGPEPARHFARRLLSLLEASPCGADSVHAFAGVASYAPGTYLEPNDLWRAAEYRLSLARDRGAGTVEVA
jgi:two-component system cell cycle response regulator